MILSNTEIERITEKQYWDIGNSLALDCEITGLTFNEQQDFLKNLGYIFKIQKVTTKSYYRENSEDEYKENFILTNVIIVVKNSEFTSKIEVIEDYKNEFSLYNVFLKEIRK